MEKGEVVQLVYSRISSLSRPIHEQIWRHWKRSKTDLLINKSVCEDLKALGSLF